MEDFLIFFSHSISCLDSFFSLSLPIIWHNATTEVFDIWQCSHVQIANNQGRTLEKRLLPSTRGVPLSFKDCAEVVIVFEVDKFH